MRMVVKYQLQVRQPVLIVITRMVTTIGIMQMHFYRVLLIKFIQAILTQVG